MKDRPANHLFFGRHPRNFGAVRFTGPRLQLAFLHYPVLELTSVFYRKLEFSPNLRIALTFGVCVPACVGLAYAFHLVFERPFMPGRPRTIREAEIVAEASPAP